MHVVWCVCVCVWFVCTDSKKVLVSEKRGDGCQPFVVCKGENGDHQKHRCAIIQENVTSAVVE